MHINEIFYSLQGEGRFTGTPAVFLRLSGCNMKCPFCDTQHESYTEMSEEEIVRDVSKYPARHIVITGGEPTLQLTPSLCRKLHDAGFFIQIETNGSLPLSEASLPETTLPLPLPETPLPETTLPETTLPETPLPETDGLCDATCRIIPSTSIDWITCSPKGNAIRIQRIDELKLLFIDSYLQQYGDSVEAKEYRLQPLDTGNEEENKRNIKATIDYILENPKWKLSLQTHKILNVR